MITLEHETNVITDIENILKKYTTEYSFYLKRINNILFLTITPNCGWTTVIKIMFLYDNLGNVKAEFYKPNVSDWIELNLHSFTYDHTAIIRLDKDIDEQLSDLNILEHIQKAQKDYKYCKKIERIKLINTL